MRMTATPSLIALVLLAGCDAAPTEVGPGSDAAIEARERADPVGRAAKSAGPVVLPPSIVGSKSFRCSDNSLALVEFYSDGRSASVRTDAKSPQVRVTSPEAGGTMTADGGWSLKGGPKDGKVTFSSPAHPKPMSCHV